MYTIIGADQKEYGPVTEEQILQWISEGRINGKTLAKIAGGAWKPVATFPELAVHLPVAAPTQAAGFADAPPALPAPGAGREAALRQLKSPATGLILTGVLGFIFTAIRMFSADNSLELLKTYSAEPQFDWIFRFIQSPSYRVYQITASLLAMLFCATIIYGGVKMKSLQSRGFCIAASILAIVPCVCPVCCVGIPFGIWALIVLGRPEVSSQFR